MKELSLDGAWDLHEAPLTARMPDADAIQSLPDGWIPAAVPGDVKDALFQAGHIADPLVGLNSFDCSWTEDRSWWFRRRFRVPASWKKQCARIELELDGLDIHADVWCNGLYIGHHPTVFRPFRCDVADALRFGDDNVVLIRLTCGTDRVSSEDLRLAGHVETEAGRDRNERGDPRRVLLRKPAFSFGWDWAPRLATCGIAYGARLRPIPIAAIRSVHPSTCLVDGQALVTVAADVDVVRRNTLLDGFLDVTLTDASGRRHTASAPVLWRAGMNYPSVVVCVPKPRLWWPNGAGEPNLYTLTVTARIGKHTIAVSRPCGLRTCELDASEDRFALRINGVTLFAKGGNWVPADSLYARVDDARYETLVREAADAHFNVLRIWGGGLYEKEAFYDACDRHGIMVWQDFMFACAEYPDNIESFREEIGREADYQTRRLRAHPCLVLLSGNNECHAEAHARGCLLYDYLLPSVSQANCPDIPYWNGSPYGGRNPNVDECGDCHHWHWSMNADMSLRTAPESYDIKERLLFASEYGYVGPSVLRSIRHYLGSDPVDTSHPAWAHHTNTYEQQVALAGIRRHYRDTDDLSFDDYLLYAGLCQGLVLGYSLDALRRRPLCNGAIFWMYNDCWGEIGWTIVDACLERKISYHFVRRALAPIRLVLRRQRDAIECTLANDSPKPVRGRIAIGSVAPDGSKPAVTRTPVQVDAFAKKVVASLPLDVEQPNRLLFARPIAGVAALPAILKPVEMRSIDAPEADLVLAAQRRGKDVLVTASSPSYLHAVHIETPAGVAADDNYFDLLPGESRTITLSGAPLARCRSLPAGAVRFAAGTAHAWRTTLPIPAVRGRKRA